MRLVHAHFPINVVIPKDGSFVTVKNFLGGKHDKTIKAIGGTKIILSTEVKDEILIEGNDNAAVSLVCSQIRGIGKVGRKDERKFLDGIFVSKKELIEPKEE
jgi:large subunit ribosomal protein L9e